MLLPLWYNCQSCLNIAQQYSKTPLFIIVDPILPTHATVYLDSMLLILRGLKYVL